jgi:hypothetical protein
MSHVARLTGLALLGALLAACDDAPSAGEAFVQIIGTTCEKAHECRDEHPGLDAAFVVEYGDTVEDCRRRYGLAGVVGGMIEDQVDQGRVDYDADAAEACIDGLDDASCDEIWLPLGGLDRPEACRAVFTFPDGE